MYVEERTARKRTDFCVHMFFHTHLTPSFSSGPPLPGGGPGCDWRGPPPPCYDPYSCGGGPPGQPR